MMVLLQRTVILALCLSTVAWAQESKEEQKKNEEEAKARLVEFKKDLRAARNSESNIALAITRLGEGVKHKRIVLELKRWLANRSLEIAATQRPNPFISQPKKITDHTNPGLHNSHLPHPKSVT